MQERDPDSNKWLVRATAGGKMGNHSNSSGCIFQTFYNTTEKLTMVFSLLPPFGDTGKRDLQAKLRTHFTQPYPFLSQMVTVCPGI